MRARAVQRLLALGLLSIGLCYWVDPRLAAGALGAMLLVDSFVPHRVR